MSKRKSFWRLWAKAIGDKSGSSDSEANKIAFFRSMIVLQAVIANTCIVVTFIYNFWVK